MAGGPGGQVGGRVGGWIKVEIRLTLSLSLSLVELRLSLAIMICGPIYQLRTYMKSRPEKFQVGPRLAKIVLNGLVILFWFGILLHLFPPFSFTTIPAMSNPTMIL